MGLPSKTGSGRVFTIKGRAGPAHEPLYHQSGAWGTSSWGQGDVTKIEIPSDRQYNTWTEIDSYQASADRATGTLSIYEDFDRSDVMELIRLRCPFDVQIHLGCDGDPRDFDLGWNKIKFFEDARGTSYDPSERAAMEGGGQQANTEDMPVSARDIYDGLRMTFKFVAQNEVGESVIAIKVCDRITCATCEDEVFSDGCQRVLAVTSGVGTSPGVLPQVIITTDQYKINAIIERWITTFAIGEQASDAACVGSYFVVSSQAGLAFHYANLADMVNQVETWAKVVTGLVAAKGPNAMWNYSPMLTFVAAEDGYIYLMRNPADGVTVLDAGAATADDLNDIAGYDAENVAAVGDATAFVYTTDGASFSTGGEPSGPTNLEAVAYRTRKEIWVGGTGSGNVYYTTDYGDTWTTKALPGSLTQVDKIIWASDSVGFILGQTATPNARVLRTVNGGYTWYVMPEAPGLSLPTFDYANDADVCEKDVNKLFIGGLADNGGDGVIVKSSDG
jgi:hypothetical protein